MRKFYCFGLLMLLSMALCGGTAMAQRKVTVDNIEYRCSFYDPVATVIDGKSATGEVVIPTEVEYEGKKYTVTTIFEKSFMGNTAITSVEIPASVNHIVQHAFYGCTSLVSITGGADTLKLDGNPFMNTPWLTNLPKENGVAYWKGWAFCTDVPNGFDELRIKEGTVGIVYNSGNVLGKTMYLPKSLQNFPYADANIRVEKFVVDKENPTFFSDDYGAIYKKKDRIYYYDQFTYMEGQNLYCLPKDNPASTFEVAEGTKGFGDGSCYYGNFEKIIVPEGCEVVPRSSLNYLRKCKHIELPSTLKLFGFSRSWGDFLLEIVLKAKEVPKNAKKSSEQFTRCENVTLYVPKESLDKYLADPNYNGKFKEIKAIPDDAPLKGDVNGDGKVNAADVTTVYNYIANPEATGLTLDKVDINGDGNVNATDITDLYNIIQGE